MLSTNRNGFYRYYDTPDGEDFLKKEYFLVRRAYPFGIYAALLDNIGKTRPVGVIPVAVRFLTIFVRPVVMVTLWNTTTFMLTRLRRLDGPSNHVLGMIPVAWYFSRFMPSVIAYGMCIPFSLILGALKMWKMTYPNTQFYGEVSTYRDDADGTIYADYMRYLWLGLREKNWMTLEAAIKEGYVASLADAKQKKLTNYRDGTARGIIRVADGSENNIFLGPD